MRALGVRMINYAYKIWTVRYGIWLLEGLFLRIIPTQSMRKIPNFFAVPKVDDAAIPMVYTKKTSYRCFLEVGIDCCQRFG